MRLECTRLHRPFFGAPHLLRGYPLFPSVSWDTRSNRIKRRRQSFSSRVPGKKLADPYPEVTLPPYLFSDKHHSIARIFRQYRPTPHVFSSLQPLFWHHIIRPTAGSLEILVVKREKQLWTRWMIALLREILVNTDLPLPPYVF